MHFIAFKRGGGELSLELVEGLESSYLTAPVFIATSSFCLFECWRNEKSRFMSGARNVIVIHGATMLPSVMKNNDLKVYDEAIVRSSRLRTCIAGIPPGVRSPRHQLDCKSSLWTKAVNIKCSLNHIRFVLPAYFETWRMRVCWETYDSRKRKRISPPKRKYILASFSLLSFRSSAEEMRNLFSCQGLVIVNHLEANQNGQFDLILWLSSRDVYVAVIFQVLFMYSFAYDYANISTHYRSLSLEVWEMEQGDSEEHDINPNLP